MFLTFFFFKQETAYERRISDWSSDVCSSDRQVSALAQKIEQDARQRAEWTAQAGVGVNALHRAAGELQRVSAGVWWDRLKEWITAALIGLGLICAAALAYRWAQEPKIERQLYGCTAKWDAKTQTCKGKWVPLYEQQP